MQGIYRLGCLSRSRAIISEVGNFNVERNMEYTVVKWHFGPVIGIPGCRCVQMREVYGLSDQSNGPFSSLGAAQAWLIGIRCSNGTPYMYSAVDMVRGSIFSGFAFAFDATVVIF